ncbi:MAG: cytochrome c biogenesis protein CcdA [Candidatus Paceibacterota bacterium]
MILNFVALHAGSWFLPVIITAAVVDSINPCAFSILFLTITFLFSLGKNRKFVLIAGGVYILGIAFVYTFIGIGLLKVLSFFAVPNGLAKIGAAILILYTVIGLINEFIPSFPLKLKIPAGAHKMLALVITKASIPGSFLLGILVGVFEFPCTGGPYLFVLSLLHDQGHFWEGFGYLLIYNVIFILPLVLILAFAVNQIVLEKIEKLRKLETKKSRTALLLLLLLIGIAIYFI